jgi:alpha-methylacyl-CoA racemase
MKERMQAIFKQKTRDEWCTVMEGSDVCFAPVLSMTEAQRHPHIRARHTFVEVAGSPQPGPAPRFSRSPTAIERPPPDWGLDGAAIRKLREAKAIT